MNQTFRSYFGKTALAVVGVAVLAASATFAQVTAPEAYANGVGLSPLTPRGRFP